MHIKIVNLSPIFIFILVFDRHYVIESEDYVTSNRLTNKLDDYVTKELDNLGRLVSVASV